MSKKALLILSVFMVVSLALASCAGLGANAGTIKIATQSPLSGDQSAIGVDIKNGAQLALEQLAGPLQQMGFKLELVPFDDMAKSEQGINNAKKIVADPEILCVVGHYNSGVQIPSSEEYHAANLANVSPANTNPNVTERNYLEVSRIVGRDDLQGRVGAQFAKEKGIKTVYVIHDKTTYGQGIAQFFKEVSEELGTQVIAFEGTEEKANFDAVLTPLLAAKPELVYFGGMYPQASVLFKQARERGYMGMFLSDDGYDSPEAATIGGDALLQGGGTFYTTVSGPAKAYEGTATFQKDFKAKFNADPKPFAAQSYDSMAICLKAIENAAKANGNKMPTRSAVSNAVRELKDFPGITGTFNFNPEGDLVMAKYFIIQVTSADPAMWADNNIAQILEFEPPK